MRALAKIVPVTLALLAAAPVATQPVLGPTGDTGARSGWPETSGGLHTDAARLQNPDGRTAGDMRAVRITNRQMQMPRITLAASRDTIIAGIETLLLTATREAPFDAALTVQLTLSQDQNWLSLAPRQLVFGAGAATSSVTITAGEFSSDVTTSGSIMATIDSVAGHDTGDASATVYVVSQDGPAIEVFFDAADYQFAEDAEDAFVTVVARAAAGMPRGATVGFSVISLSGTAASPDDYQALSTMPSVAEEDFALEQGRWTARARVPLTLVDDDVREGAESLNLRLERAPGFGPDLGFTNPLGGSCGNRCLASVEITDEEDIPNLHLVLFRSEEEIREEDESSAQPRAIILNDKRFASDQQVTFSFGGTATQGTDYVVSPEDADGQTAGHQVVLPAGEVLVGVTLTAVNDDVNEPDEEIEILATHDGDAISDPATVRIVNRVVPVLELSLSAGEIQEEGETSATATVSITNGKTFATDEMLTFELGGDAIAGHDYRVTPSDADEGAGHQVTLRAGSSSVEVTFTAIDDEREEGDERITLAVSHEGDDIGSETIHVIDRSPGPSVEITFEGVQPPRDRYTAGVATGSFTTRFTFSEPVEGFTQEDIRWQTHSLTTIDTTNIAVLVWDYTVVREGLEYTARMMPDQDGLLWIDVFPGAATSVATGDGNQLGANSLWVDFPPNRLMAEPGKLTVEEGDEDGAQFLVLLTSEPTGPVTVTVSGMDGTALAVDRPTITFTLPYWNGGWWVTVTAGNDANTRDETVRLTVGASGGGYDGHSTTVVVTVRDTGARAQSASDSDADTESDALSLLEDVTPEAAAAALFGEGSLSDAQLMALDRLGNANGGYDLGDLLSWTARCRQGEARCGQPVSLMGMGSALASGVILAVRRRGRTRRRTIGHSPGGRGTDRPRALSGNATRWLRLLMLAAVTVAWGCGAGDDLAQPQYPADPPAQLEPGLLDLWLTVPPGAGTSGAMLIVEGPGIDSLRAPGLDLIHLDESAPGRRKVIVAGALTTGTVLQIGVPHIGHRARYRVQLLQVAGDDYTLTDPVRYRVAIVRRHR